VFFCVCCCYVHVSITPVSCSGVTSLNHKSSLPASFEPDQSVTTTAAIASSSIANSSEEDNDVMMKETLMGECAEEGKKSAGSESGKCEWIRRGDCCSAAMEADPLVWLTFTARPRVSEKKGVRLFLKVA